MCCLWCVGGSVFGFSPHFSLDSLVEWKCIVSCCGACFFLCGLFVGSTSAWSSYSSSELLLLHWSTSSSLSESGSKGLENFCCGDLVLVAYRDVLFAVTPPLVFVVARFLGWVCSCICLHCVGVLVLLLICCLPFLRRNLLSRYHFFCFA